MDRKDKERKLLLLREKQRREWLSNYSDFSNNYIKITNKKGQTVPLKQNYVQQQIHSKMQELRSKGIPPRIIVLKSRQVGVSTDTQGRMIYETNTKPNRNGFIVSQDDDSTSVIFQKAKYMFDNLPDDVKPLQKASNAKELIFDTPSFYKGTQKGLHSKIEIAVAGNARIGRSETRHYVHLSEFALWPGNGENSPDKQLSSIMQSVPDDIDTWVIIESTAKGLNQFYDLWNDAVDGKNGWVPMFFPWMDDITYQMELYDGEREILLNTLTEYEQWLYNTLNLPLERVKWWRETKKNKCNNDINQMKQENPTTAEEAFIFSGSPVFNTDKIKQRIEVLRQQTPLKCGYFYFEWNDPDLMDMPKKDTIRWVDDKNGCIKMYAEPLQGYPYVIGGDTKGEGSDLFAGTVKNNNTGKRVATLHGQMKSKPYTAQMISLGYYYNTALLGIEINFNTYPIELLSDWKYPRQYLREKTDIIGTWVQAKFGWKTDGNTRPLIIERMVTLIDENIENFVDIDTLQEALTFVKDKNGRPDAMSGKHDDLLLSDMICEGISDQQTHILPKEPQEIDPESKEGKFNKMLDNLGREVPAGFFRW